MFISLNVEPETHKAVAAWDARGGLHVDAAATGREMLYRKV
jgi:hypothetical protein